MKNLGERFQNLLDHFRITKLQLAEDAGVSDTAIGDIISGKTLNPKIGIFINICQKRQVNLDWLVLGEGEMLQESSSPSITEQKLENVIKTLEAEVVDLLKEKRALEKENKELKLRLQSK